jgi:hypothetical protein
MKSLDQLSHEELWSELLKQHDFREKHCTLIGHIVVEFATIEIFLSSFLADVLNHDDMVPVLMVIGKLSLAQMVEMARVAFPLQEKELQIQEQFEIILHRIEELRVKRNGVIHSFWEYDVDSQRVSYVRTLPDKKGKIYFKETFYTIKEFEDLVPFQKIKVVLF